MGVVDRLPVSACAQTNGRRDVSSGPRPRAARRMLILFRRDDRRRFPYRQNWKLAHPRLQTHLLQQGDEAWVLAEGIERRVDLQPDDRLAAVVVDLLQEADGFVVIAERDADAGEKERDEAGAGLQLLDCLQRFVTVPRTTVDVAPEAHQQRRPSAELDGLLRRRE